MSIELPFTLKILSLDSWAKEEMFKVQGRETNLPIQVCILGWFLT